MKPLIGTFDQTSRVKATYFLILHRTGKAYQSHSKGKQAGRGFIKNRVSIDKRRHIVDDKSRLGDREFDLVIGKRRSGALVTIVKRIMTKYMVFIAAFGVCTSELDQPNEKKRPKPLFSF